METVSSPALTSPGLKSTNTLAHTIAQVLLRHGVRVVFGQSLPSMLHLAAEELGIRQVGYRTENAGGHGRRLRAFYTGRPW